MKSFRQAHHRDHKEYRGKKIYYSDLKLTHVSVKRSDSVRSVVKNKKVHHRESKVHSGNNRDSFCPTPCGAKRLSALSSKSKEITTKVILYLNTKVAIKLQAQN